MIRVRGLGWVALWVALLLPGCTASEADCQSDVPRGVRQLGLGVTAGAVGYEAALRGAKTVGMQFVELAQQWDEVEQASGEFDGAMLDLMVQIYARLDTAIVLSINPIDTASLRVPRRLTGRPFDDPSLLADFIRFADFVIARVPGAKIAAVSIGNEVGATLGGDIDAWAQYARFATSVRAHIKRSLPNVPVGVKTTLVEATGGRRLQIAAINQAMDAVMLTYYPLDSNYTVLEPTGVVDALQAGVALGRDKPVMLLEVGYPSGGEAGSSEIQQADFVETVFRVWDQHAQAVPMVNFVWTHDVPASAVDEASEYYGVEAPGFAAFIATLGLKSHAGEPKLAHERLRACAESRGWQG